MKNKKLKLLGSASAAAVALALSPLVGAQTQSSAGSYNQPSPQASGQSADSASAQPASALQRPDGANPGEPGALRVAPKDESKHTAEKLAGRKVRGQGGSELGTVKDFLVDPHSGAVRFAVVSTGGVMGVGDRLHLVPFRALQEDAKGFTASLSKQQLDQAPVLNEEQFEENKVSLNGADFQNATSRAVEANAAPSGRLVRATKIKSHEVKANGTDIGSIEGVVIEPGSTDAVALLRPAKDITETKQKFLVPLNRFTISGKKDNAITTTLTRADFEAAGPYNATASAAPAAPTRSGDATALTTQQNQDVASASASTLAPSALAQTDSISNAAEQAQTASSSTRTTSPLSDTASPNRTSVAANPSGPATQNTASTDQFGASTSPAGSSSGFAQNAPSASDASTASVSSTASRDGQADVASSDSSASPRTATVEKGTDTPGLTPTGQTSADQNPQADPTLISAAESIRHALDTDPETAHADVRVTPQNGKVVLQGEVASDSLKAQIEKKAQAAANGAEIDSQLKVQDE